MARGITDTRGLDDNLKTKLTTAGGERLLV